MWEVERIMLKTMPISQEKNIAVHGRTTPCRQPLTLFWSASSVELNFRGTELWAGCETDYAFFEQWLSVVLNGAHVARIMLPKGRAWIPLLRGLNPEKTQHILLVRDVQAMPTDPDCSFKLHALRHDGELLPVPEKKLRLEIIGDSLTSSEGAIGAKEEEDWISTIFCAARGYAFRTAQLLDADLRVLSQSGWGVLSSWDNDPNCALPMYYDQVCGVLKGEKNAALGAFEPNNFAAWQPQVIVVALGHNDSSAFCTPAHTDPVTGETFKQHMDPDGSRNAQDVQRLEQAIIAFLYKLRARNPQAHILWAHGLLGDPLREELQRALNAYCAQTGDTKCEYFALPYGPEDGIGARNHPGRAMHEASAQALAQKIRSLV